MKSHLTREDIFNNLKHLVFLAGDTADLNKNIALLFTLAKEFHDIESINILANDYLFMEAIIFLESHTPDLPKKELIDLIIENASYEVIKDNIEHGAYINKKNSTGDTALIRASLLNKYDITKLLLINGANANERVENGDGLVKRLFALGFKEVLELLIEHDGDNIFEEYAVIFFNEIDELITSEYIAKQFVYEELDAARSGNDEARHFVETSGVKEELYLKAMKQSLPEVDGDNGPQQILLSECFKLLNQTDNRDLIAKIRRITVEKVMSKWRIGKYEKKVLKLTLDNQSEIFLHSDHASIDDEKFEMINENKYYHPERKIYLEIQSNNVAVFFRPTYNHEDEEKEFFGVLSQEDILKTDVKHNPKRLVEILNYFTKDNPVKYTAHSFDWNRYGTYDNFLNEVKNTFDSIDEDLKRLSPNLHEKITKFLFSDQLNQDNTWGLNRMSFGWSSPELKAWAKIEESKQNGKKAIYFPLPDANISQINGSTVTTFDDVCNVFKNEIEIRDDGKLSMLLEVLEEDILGFDFEVEYKNLDNLSFYTDVDYLRNGLVKIFEQFKDDSRKEYNLITIEAVPEEKGQFIDLFISQKGSEATKEPSALAKEIKDGDFQDIRTSFLSLCDWSILVKYQNSYYKIDYLSPNTETTVSEVSTAPDGFTHQLRFYHV